MPSALSALGAGILRTRALVRAPIWLYRHRLGWLLGDRVLMLQHTGRKSGLARYVCLEVVEHSSPDRLAVVSGFGTQAQWYRNLKEDPNCRVSIGRRIAVPAYARMMAADESDATLTRYRAAHPKAWKILRDSIEKITGQRVTSLPMVELTLARPDPP
ncbi:nitroreductase family deazaflavin-dependent oxidoreductase [Agromyces aerolatus]|uniref:nitroreductase family deazaflavin-dependent oxidoreductase n=1 Tax=Agromyces sp. LY-1074 TaxID=3074080 RepID=UPI002857CE71|nr:MULTISPECIES: nitroreductase family deazaflavin-dependent oxidoreductase [unclassified Agromyces]MDR5700921.1 nitroreductase family deazaflavin-dependent oxidoreductase [Agromyces sp. LY-1074]MDR5707418.1 nitroreductase family deazaflavin-dependent oxidoreductase [Agromyces sp. LY-1358]